MITEDQNTVIEHVRSLKEANAAEHGYSIRSIIEAARERQDSTGRRIIRRPKAEQGAAEPPLGHLTFLP